MLCASETNNRVVGGWQEMKTVYRSFHMKGYSEQFKSAIKVATILARSPVAPGEAEQV